MARNFSFFVLHLLCHFRSTSQQNAQALPDHDPAVEGTGQEAGRDGADEFLVLSTTAVRAPRWIRRGGADREADGPVMTDPTLYRAGLDDGAGDGRQRHISRPVAARAQWRSPSLADNADDQVLSARVGPEHLLRAAFALAAAPMFGREVGAILVWSDGEPTGSRDCSDSRRTATLWHAVADLIGWAHSYAPLGVPLVDRDRASTQSTPPWTSLPPTPACPICCCCLHAAADPFANALALAVFKRQGRIAGSRSMARAARAFARAGALFRRRADCTRGALSADAASPTS